MISPNEDYYGWAQETIEKVTPREIKRGEYRQLDRGVGGYGKNERRELRNRLAVLVAHLLKWQCQPNRKGKNWQSTIEEQRYQIRSAFEK